MIPPRTKTEWLAYWHRHLDDHQSRLDSPEAHRTICLDISREMADAQIIDSIERLEMDEIANAAYWHAVETLIDCEPAFMTAGFYDLVPRHEGPTFGKIRTMIYYPDATEETLGPWAAQVITENGTRRLVFRINAEVWDIKGPTVTRPDGSVCDLVLTGQRINGREYSNISDPDAYRARKSPWRTTTSSYIKMYALYLSPPKLLNATSAWITFLYVTNAKFATERDLYSDPLPKQRTLKSPHRFGTAITSHPHKKLHPSTSYFYRITMIHN